MTARLRRERPPARDRIIQFRATAEEAEFLRAEATRRGLKVADLIREAVDDYLTRKGGER